MKIRTMLPTRPIWCGHVFLASILAVLVLAGCRGDVSRSTNTLTDGGTKGLAVPGLGQPNACEMVLVPPRGDGRIEREISRVQQRIRTGREEYQSVERLGWLYVAKARESFDPGYYKLAEQCALCLESRQAKAPEALLLEGHVLQNLHHFKEAEPLARELVTRRGLSFDYGLLGDVLMEQGELQQAAEAYQKMVDQRPDLEAYARIAHLRWLKGDLAGATEVMRLATSAASPRAPEAAAWVNTRLAFFRLQAGKIEEADRICDVALDFQANYAPALLLKGRLLLAQSELVDQAKLSSKSLLTPALSRREREDVSPEKLNKAVESLQKAAQLNPLPEYLWALSEALRAAERASEANAIEEQLNREGAANDPRTFSLYLASRGESVSTALELARNELNTRQDVFTHDALAWALSANGRNGEALKEMKQALTQGTQDARLFFHATVIGTRAGRRDAARAWFKKARPTSWVLLPSEQRQLANAATVLGCQELQTPGSGLAANAIFTPGNQNSDGE